MPEATARTRVNAFDTKSGRYYELPNGDSVPSVTTFLKVLPKDALLPWAVKMTAEFAYDHKDSWANLPRQAAIDVMKGARFYDTSAVDAGNIVHKIFEDRANGVDTPTPVGFDCVNDIWAEFTRDYKVETIYAEPQVISYKHGYAGSFDWYGKINGKLTMLDWKSGNGMYGSVAPQLAAYENADTMITPEGEEIPMPEVEVLGGVWLRPEGYALRPVADKAKAWRIALSARSLYDDLKKDYELLEKAVNPNPIKSKRAEWLGKGK